MSKAKAVYEKTSTIAMHKFIAFGFAAFAAFACAFWFSAHTHIVHHYEPRAVFVSIFVLMIINATAVLTFAVLQCFEKIKLPKWSGIVATVFYIISFICFILGIVFNVVRYDTWHSVSGGDLIMYSSVAFIFVGFVLFLVYSLFFHSSIQSKKIQAIVALVLTFSILLPTTLIVANVGSTNLETGAVVFEVGDDMYSVVFATSRPAVGVIEYEIDGETRTRISSINGRPHISRVHAVRIPRDTLRLAGEYTVGFYSYRRGGMYGYVLTNRTMGESFSFYGTPQTAGELIVHAHADWHSNRVSDNVHVRATTAQMSAQETPDLVLILGDATSINITEQRFVDYIIGTGYVATGGSVPAIYVRGNHETRGAGLHQIAQMMGKRSLFFQTQIDNFLFTMFDNAEDKRDCHPEYQGFSAYYHHREEQIMWLNRLAPSNPNEVTHIALNHMTWFGTRTAYAGTGWNDTHQETQWNQGLANANVDLIIAGHVHSHHILFYGDRINPNGAATHTSQIPAIIVGGSTGNLGYVANLMRFTHGAVELQVFNEQGIIEYPNQEFEPNPYFNPAQPVTSTNQRYRLTGNWVRQYRLPADGVLQLR